jgi:hypothetical protein
MMRRWCRRKQKSTHSRSKNSRRQSRTNVSESWELEHESRSKNDSSLPSQNANSCAFRPVVEMTLGCCIARHNWVDCSAECSREDCEREQIRKQIKLNAINQWDSLTSLKLCEMRKLGTIGTIWGANCERHFDLPLIQYEYWSPNLPSSLLGIEHS